MKLHTIGYVNDSIQDFLGRLAAAKVTHVFDVRRRGSGAWCQQYRQGFGMLRLLSKHDMAYTEWNMLANNAGDLEDYSLWLSSIDGRLAVRKASALLYHQVKAFEKSEKFDPEVPCLLCCERNAEECHRKLAAEATVADIDKNYGKQWEVIHL